MNSKKIKNELPLILFFVFQTTSIGLFLSIFIYFALSGFLLFKGIYLTIFMLSAIALLLSSYHVGNKKLALRSMINIKSSWVSREIIFFALFSFLILCAYISSEWFFINKIVIFICLLFSLLSLFSSGMIYRIGHFKSWDNAVTVIRPFISSFTFCSVFLLIIAGFTNKNNPIFTIKITSVILLIFLLIDLMSTIIFEYLNTAGRHILLKNFRFAGNYIIPLIAITFFDSHNYYLQFFLFLSIFISTVIERITFFLEENVKSIETEIESVRENYQTRNIDFI